ncbi:MAG: biotin--[acetyl-CoA-carboxylase] ligase family protein [Deltaproteobacteria bacterium]|jgi:BirA family biotin operon repressor/biotin-[acetyl-CoA-carboxylase] ligase|nr:biotin--[acetyl-CoA-carboxylase] ligase family protein [Deltaproteobacteria bacterium]
MTKAPPDSTFFNNPTEPPPVIHLGEVTTVLDVAWEMAAKDALPIWGSILAKSQTQGRGRQGRVWVSPPGHVYAALRLPLKPPFSGSLASVALGYALVEALRAEGVDLLLKWPNDLLTPEGKAGGILLENRKGALIAGIGLNLGASPFPPEEREPYAPLPAALPIRLGPPEELWLRLAKNVMFRYNGDFPAKDSDWARNLCSLAEKSLAGLGEVVTIDQPVTEPRSDRPALTGTLAGLAPSGALRLVGPDGESAVWSGTLILPNRARRESP